jgi:histidinol-phosphatase
MPTAEHHAPAGDLRRYLEAALAITEEAGRLIVSHIERGFTARKKNDGTPVTEIDLETETFIRDRLVKRFPDHGIVGEEFETRNPGASFQWIIDPIDGTVSLSRGVPLFGSILALLEDGRSVVGIVSLPMLGRTYHAARGVGAYRGAVRLDLRPSASEPAIDDEIIATGDRLQFVNAGRPRAFDALVASHPRIRTYCDCFGHGLAAEGAVGAMVDFDLKIWDLAATEILIAEAGGKFERVGVRGEGREKRHDVIFGKPRVVEWLVERIGRI